MKNILFISVLFLTQLLFSQQITTESVIKKFTGKSSVEWDIPLSENEKIAIQWEKRISSLTKSEDFQSFVGYHQNALTATLTFSANNLTGHLFWKDKVWILGTEKGFIHLIPQEKPQQCGNCTHKHCKEHAISPLRYLVTSALTFTGNKLQMPNDDVLRVYRLALPISYGYFTASSRDYYKGFESNKEKVKIFWGEIEIFLNELYMRDIGIRFEVVNNEKLIADTPEKDVFKNKSSENILKEATSILNNLIGEQAYDVGLCISTTTTIGIAGQARTGSALPYYSTHKAAGVSILDMYVIAHEIGHMFGSSHTHINFQEASSSYLTESTNGQSIMSYGGGLRDFFSLASIYHIRERVFANTNYYTNKERTTKAEDIESGNIPYGIKNPHQAPQLNSHTIKESYSIPKGTSFQFAISANDPEGKPLWYMAQPVNLYNSKLAQFITQKPSKEPLIIFQPEYTTDGYLIQNTDVNVRADAYAFWVGVSDAESDLQKNHPTKYDILQTYVKVIDGIPLQITTDLKPQYQQGESLTLKWNVDTNILKDTKVRILLSKDLGKTFPYTLVAETDNDGEVTFSFPNILIGKEKDIPQGVIKIEVIDHIAIATSNRQPQRVENGEFVPYGGFELVPNDGKPTPIEWVESSLQEIKVSCKNAVTLKLPETKNGKGEVKITSSDVIKNDVCTNKYIIERTFTAVDETNKPIYIQQIIRVEDTEKPTFVGELPKKNIEIEAGQKIPDQAELTATDNCSEIKKVEKFKSEESGKVIYKWVAEDICGNIAEYSQIITIKEKAVTPIVWVENSLPKNEKVSCENIPAVATNLQANGGCSTLTISHKSDEITNRTCANSYRITRIYEAKDTCGNSKNYTQIIEVEDKTAPTFVGELPENKEIERGQEIPTQRELTAQDTCGNASVEKSVEDILENGKLVKKIYKWTAKDDCGNEITHTQTITIKEKAHSDLPKTPEIPNNPKTPKNSNLLIYNGVSPEENSENYFRMEGIDEKTTISVEIFNELGQKVFQSKNYGQKGEVFRGYPNVKGVFNPSKRLPTGTYFYILKCGNINKSGYLFVK